MQHQRTLIGRKTILRRETLLTQPAKSTQAAQAVSFLNLKQRQIKKPTLLSGVGLETGRLR
tara:strand:- start:30 stop:212 length:183 start_codon:yes stop_codon:yes gene_type:complete